ncbi:tubulin binding cofactor A [Podospora fimiseda]|uniref:Tubulin-specific chaperone A n=1 Tax=Podospora fimiseda TaxID=252190 RepID=A0AAN7BVZ9_9PEZI|nr:tubulin binding cofactor A [Podospora fimiseda]
MAPPTPLSIATQSVNRLVKEEAYYHKEQASQEARIAKLKQELETTDPADLDSNAEYMLKQEQTALEETKNVFAPLMRRIGEAVVNLEVRIAIAESEGNASEEELKKAKEAFEIGQKKYDEAKKQREAAAAEDGDEEEI